MRRSTGLVILLTAIAMKSAFAVEQQGSPNAIFVPDFMNTVAKEHRDLFQDFKLVPIIVPRGERVGDIYDSRTYRLIARTEDCFPKLEVRKAHGSLPSLTTVSEKTLAAALGVYDAASVEAGGANKFTFQLSFKDVEVRTVSTVQLRNAIPRKAAPECLVIRGYLTALAKSLNYRNDGLSSIPFGSEKALRERTASLSRETIQTQVPIVVGTVFYARRVVHIQAIKEIGAQAKASIGQYFVQLLKNFKLSAAGGVSISSQVELVSEELVPVAFAPAFESTYWERRSGNRTLIKIAEVNPFRIRTHVQLFLALIERKGLFAGRSIQKSVDGLSDPRVNSSRLFLGAPTSLPN